MNCVAGAAVVMDSAKPRRYQYFAATNTLQEIKAGSNTAVDKLGYQEWEDGWELESQKDRADLVKYLDEDYENSIQITFIKDLYHQAISVFIALSEVVGPKLLYGHSPGLCAGGGQAQLRPASMKVSQKEGIPEVTRTGGVGRSLRYPCETCTAGLGFVGAMCNCHEWAVAPSKQIFSSTYANKFAEHSNVANMDQSGVTTARVVCSKALLEHPAGKAFYTTKMYRQTMSKQM